MRPVRAREVNAKRSERGGRRSKRGVRTSDFRPEKRAPAGRPADAADALGRLDRLRNHVLLRRPVLAVTIALVTASGAFGLISGGHVAAALDDAGTAMRSIIAASGFAVHGVSLTGYERTPPKAAYAALGVKEGQDIFALDPQAIRARLKRLPWVADAVVRRRLPDVLMVRLIEKRPFALWNRDGEFVAVERSGAVIEGGSTEGLEHLPVLVGEGAPEAAAPLLDSLSLYRALSQRLTAVARVADRRWDLLLSGGVTVRLPEENWEAELGELEKLIVDKGVLERDIEMIDLRYPDQYVFRLHNGDSRPVPRERRA